MRPPLRRIAIAICCFGLAGCGGDDAEDHAAVIDEGTALLGSAVAATPSSDAENKLGELAQKLRSLATRARSLDAPPEAKRDELAQKMRREWEPAMGKIHAASLAALETRGSETDLAPTLYDLESAVSEADSAILQSLDLAPE